MCEQSYHHKDLKNTLIKEGIHYINVYGERSLSMRKLAALCHVSHTALYKHFQNKEEFMNAISAYIEEQFTEALQRSYENAGGDVDEAIIQIGAGYVAFMVQHPDFLKYHTNIMKSQMFQLQDLEKKSVKSYEIFRSTALAFLKKHGCPPEEYQKEILTMWSLVMGLSDMLAYKIIDSQKDALKTAEEIIRREIKLRCSPPCAPTLPVLQSNKR